MSSDEKLILLDEPNALPATSQVTDSIFAVNYIVCSLLLAQVAIDVFTLIYNCSNSRFRVFESGLKCRKSNLSSLDINY